MSTAENVRCVHRVAKGVYGVRIASWDVGGRRCPAAAIQVRTYRVLDGVPRPANDVAFHLLVGGAS